jgi:uncharacterized protein YecE (DUF72 family)
LEEAGKLGVLLLQYPAGFHFSAENLEKVQSTLRWSYDYPKAVDLRHYDYLYSRAEIKKHAERIKIAASTPGVKKAFAFYNNHARANAAANAIMLSQELGVRLRTMPPEAMLQKFPDLVREPEAFT